MPLHFSEYSYPDMQVLDAVINKSLVNTIQDTVDDDGSVKDTAV
jgi:hypothetical protein